jgi:hypothetical protein
MSSDGVVSGREPSPEVIIQEDYPTFREATSADDGEEYLDIPDDDYEQDQNPRQGDGSIHNGAMDFGNLHQSCTNTFDHSARAVQEPGDARLQGYRPSGSTPVAVASSSSSAGYGGNQFNGTSAHIAPNGYSGEGAVPGARTTTQFGTLGGFGIMPPSYSNAFQQRPAPSYPPAGPPPVRSQEEGSPEVEVVGESNRSIGGGHPGSYSVQRIGPGPVRPLNFTPYGTYAGPSGSSAARPEQKPPPPATTVSRTDVAIDLTDDDVAARYSMPPAPAQPANLDMSDRRPVCIGSIDTQALILYPISIMQKGSSRDELIRFGELRVDHGGEEWLKVKLKFRKGKGVGTQGTMTPGADGTNGPSADTVINIMSCESGRDKGRFLARR